jgi:hypothetical protein
MRLGMHPKLCDGEATIHTLLGSSAALGVHQEIPEERPSLGAAVRFALAEQCAPDPAEGRADITAPGVGEAPLDQRVALCQPPLA